MKVTSLETVQLAEYPNLLWVLVGTDEGLVGLGETFFGARAVAAHLHETVAPQLVGGDPLAVEHWSRTLRGYLGGEGPGAEARAASAIDLALWDLLGQASGQPLHVLLGGRTRESIRIYNTCAGPRYIRERPTQSVDNWGLPAGQGEPLDDLQAFMTRADELAHELLEEGVTGMKVWPFDPAAEAHGGAWLSAADLDAALEPVRRIREAAGTRMDIMVELHSGWSVSAAKRIARALEPYAPAWLEDPVPMANARAVAEVASATSAPIAGGETIAGRRRFAELLALGALDVLILDVSWCGGLTEARKIAALAESHEVSVAPHDCTGPVVLAASTHLSMSLPNAIVQETTRASYRTWYRELVTDLPPITRGEIRPLTAPGLGTQLLPGLRLRADATVLTSRQDGSRIETRARTGEAVA